MAPQKPSMTLDRAVVGAVAEALNDEGYFVTKFDFAREIADLKRNPASGQASVSITRIIRGLTAMQGRVLDKASYKTDIEYAEKTLTTGTTPGTYLVPTIQAGTIIEILGKGGVVRASGATIWPMENIDKMNLPTETAEPTVEYLDQAVGQSPSDPGLGQISLSLKTRRSLVALPNELLKTSSPAADKVVTRLLGKALAKTEDRAFFTGMVGGPTDLMSAPNINLISQAGASLEYTDLLGMLEEFYSAEAEGDIAWYMHPRVFFGKVLNIRDTDGHLVVQPQASSTGIKFTLFGAPVWLTPRIPVNLGSPAVESYICLTNPEYFHIGSGNVEIAVSTDRYFDSNQSAVRAVHRHDFGYAPPSGIVLLDGVK